MFIRNTIIALSLLSTSGYSFSAKGEHPDIEHFLSANYTKSGSDEYPWHKETSDSEMKDYELCVNTSVPGKDSMTLIVMCPDTDMATQNEEHPTDIYIFKNNKDNIELLTKETNAGVDFDKIDIIGINKWAIRVSSYSMGRGLLQENTELLVLDNNKLSTIASWTGMLDNSGDAGDSPELSRMENIVSFDSKSNPNDEYYPMLITSKVTNGKSHKSNKYRIKYNEKKSTYSIPEELASGY